MYLLLRNEQQSGPYTLEDLVSLKLSPADRVQIAGESSDWQVPGDIPELAPYVSSLHETAITSTIIKTKFSIRGCVDEISGSPSLHLVKQQQGLKRPNCVVSEIARLQVIFMPGITGKNNTFKYIVWIDF